MGLHSVSLNSELPLCEFLHRGLPPRTTRRWSGAANPRPPLLVLSARLQSEWRAIYLTRWSLRVFFFSPHNERFQTICENTVVNISDSKNHFLIRIKSIRAQTNWNARNLTPDSDPPSSRMKENLLPWVPMGDKENSGGIPKNVFPAMRDGRIHQQRQPRVHEDLSGALGPETPTRVSLSSRR